MGSKGRPMTRVARSGLNYVTGLMLSLTTLALSLWATPRILHYLNDERAGAFRAMMDWLGYLALLELGLSGALMPLIAAAISKSDQSRLRGLLGEGFRIYRRVALLMIAAALVLVIAMPHVVPVSAAL